MQTTKKSAQKCVNSTLGMAAALVCFGWFFVGNTASAQRIAYKSLSSAELQKLCDGDDSAACFYLARNYAYGGDVPRDGAKSSQLYLKACGLGHKTACSDHDSSFGGTRGAQMLSAAKTAAIAKRTEAEADVASFDGFPRASAAQAKLLSDAIKVDSMSWSLNKYDDGSLSRVRTTGPGLVRGDYTYNDGTDKGWVEARVSADRVECLTYHDTGFCAAVRPAAGKGGTFSTLGERPDIPWGEWSQERNIQCIFSRNRTIVDKTLVYNRTKNEKTGISGGGSTAYINYVETEFENRCGSQVKFKMACPKIGLLGDSFVSREDVLNPRQKFRIYPGGCTYLEEIGK